MILTIQHRFTYYRRFEEDIWGLARNNLQLGNSVATFFYQLHLKRAEVRKSKKGRFLYRIDVINPLSVKRRFKLRFLSLRLVRLFFLTLKYAQFRKMAKIAAAKDGTFQDQYGVLLEGRQLSFLYRTNFLSSLFEMIAFIRLGNMRVNGISSSYLNLVIGVGDIVFISKNKTPKLRANLLKRLLLYSSSLIRRVICV